jgi:hypothetical protein
MYKSNDFAKLGQVYGGMLNGMKHKLVSEGKIGPKVKPGEIGDAPLVKGGPQETAGYMPAKVDRKKMSDKELKDNLYNIKNLSEPEHLEEDEEDMKDAKHKAKKVAKKAVKGKEKVKTKKESGKIVKESINNFMRSKSIFDKLYENVTGQFNGMSPMGSEMEETEELDALGIEGEGEGMEEAGDEISLKLDRETAQKLIDVLQAAIGDGEEEVEVDEFEMEDGDEMEDEGEEMGYDEDEEDLGASSHSKEINYGKNNKVGNLKAQSGGASSAYTDKVGADGDHGHALVNAKQPNMGKSNKVGTLKTGKSAFEQ